MGIFFLFVGTRGLNWVGNAMADSVWRGSGPFVRFRWVVISAQMANGKWPFVFYGTQVSGMAGAACMGLTT
jgi:hypothetical protein